MPKKRLNLGADTRAQRAARKVAASRVPTIRHHASYQYTNVSASWRPAHDSCKSEQRHWTEGVTSLTREKREAVVITNEMRHKRGLSW